METIGEQVSHAAQWLLQYAGEFGGDPGKLTVPVTRPAPIMAP